MSDFIVSMKVPMARDVVTTLRTQVDSVNRKSDRLPGISAQADDPFGTATLFTLLGEASEETAGLATLIENLANLSEAADLGMISLEELSRLEAEVVNSANTVSASINDGSGASGSDVELLIAIHLGLVEPNEIDQATYDLAIGLATGDFDLTDSFVGGPTFPDGTQWSDSNIISDGTGPMTEHVGGGAVLGPDGRYYPIVVPIQTDADGNRYTTGYQEDGWTQIGHTNGTGQFVRGLPAIGPLVIGAGVASGADFPATTNDDTLPGIRYRDGLPPVLTQVPAINDAVSVPGDDGYLEDVTGSPTAGNLFDLFIQGANGYDAFQNAGQNDDRAYEVAFEQHEETGEIRAIVTTHSVGVSIDVQGNEDPTLRGDHVYLDDDNELAQVPAVYRGPDQPVVAQGGVLTSEPIGDLRSAAEIRSRPLGLGDGAIDVQTDHLDD